MKLNYMLIPTLLSVLVTIKCMSTVDQGVETSSGWNLLKTLNITFKYVMKIYWEYVILNHEVLDCFYPQLHCLK